MNKVQQYRDYAWMSQASYLNLSNIQLLNHEDYLSALTTEKEKFANDKLFSEAHANLFTDEKTGYSFVHHQANTTTSGINTGYSATIFQSNENKSSYTYAVRGTEAEGDGRWIDLVQDLTGVVGSGKAITQLLLAYHDYKRITTGEDQEIVYSAAEKDYIANLIGMKPIDGGLEVVEKVIAKVAYSSDKENLGLGLINADATVNFTGHSLGGHLAYLLE